MGAPITMIKCIFVIFFALLSQKCVESKHSYEIRKFEVPIDHFNFAYNKTFNMRYLYNDTFAEKKTASPILFYTGNEGNIELFAENSGFIWELAKELKTIVVFAEHRYYGDSLPFGTASLNVTSNLGYLSVEQTLEDYVDLINFLKIKNPSPVIAFGGSYGGMLSAWLRMKYPHIVQGALASSAPIWQFNDLVPCDIFYKILSSVFSIAYNSNCSLNIKNSWSVLKNYSSTDEGRAKLNTKFQFCQPMKQQTDISKFFDYLEDVYGNLAMVNYPYASEFLAPLPAYPVREFCYHLKDIYNDEQLINAMVKALSVYTNYTGQTKCLDYQSAYNEDMGTKAWEIQTCNQMVMPMCCQKNETMFPNRQWNFQDYSKNCIQKYNIRPKENDIIARYGGKNIETSSNIIFSNGLLDPWSGGGVLQGINEHNHIIILPEGAHHIDLRESQPSDPPSVVDARNLEKQIIKSWIVSAEVQKIKH